MSTPTAAAQKPPIFLLDTMSFIFRAYHVMQRQRPMSTRTGVPTAATYVFVNMINKLRRDFSPQYFAAVFDVSSPVFRDERASTMKTVRKWNLKTQQFDEVDYGGYKANREAMPPDLTQQLPYIRRALEAFHIPILQHEGFEADDVIGTLGAKAAAEEIPVFIVSSDKDMLQLVNEHVKVLNPMKDNLILDRAKVEETLGVPPEQVIDVMALRGDSIDNIPGAPGIGDKGSIELIRQFGSVEAALDRAGEVKGKRQRESLENNRDAVLLSKELVTIHTEVPVALELERMRTTEPDLAACRALFSELEFTTLLKELAPEQPAVPVEYLLEPTSEQVQAFLTAARSGGFAIAVPASELEQATEQVSEQETEAAEEREPALRTMMLDFSATAAVAEPAQAASPKAFRVGVANDAAGALLLDVDVVRTLLEDAAIPKQVHDLKGAMRGLGARGITLAGADDDLMLFSYLVNPTHATHRLPDVAARFSNRPLQEQGEQTLPEAAHAIRTLAPKLLGDVEGADLMECTRQSTCRSYRCCCAWSMPACGSTLLCCARWMPSLRAR